MTDPPQLVWVSSGNKHQQAAHLLQTKKEACQIKWVVDGYVKWVPKRAVQSKLPPRRRRLPRKLVDPDEPPSESDADTMTDSESESQDEGSSIGGGQQISSPTPVSVDESEDEELDNSFKAKEKSSKDNDEDGDVSLSSTSLSTMTDQSHDEDTRDANLITPTEQELAAQDDASPLSSTQDSSNSYGTVQPVRCSAFSFGGAPSNSDSSEKPVALSNETSAFATLRGVMSKRVKSMFSWKRRTRAPKASTCTNIKGHNETLGKKRQRADATKPPLGKKRRTGTDVVHNNASKNETLIEEVIRRIALESYENVREGIDRRVKAGKTLNAFITLRDADGSQRTISPILSWASDRYDDNENRSKAFLSEVDLKKDASVTLKLLLDNGANPYVADKETGQTPLHAAAAGGFKVAVKSLLDQVVYSVDQLNVIDNNGDTALHAAIRNGNYDCFELFMKKYPTETVLEEVFDRHGENVLATLVRYTDIPYDEDTSASPNRSESFALLKKLLAVVKAERLTKPMIHRNKVGETVMAVAAICGCYHELKELSKVEFDSGRSVSNRCVVVEGELQSPLDLARKTKELVERWATQLEFEERRIDGIGSCFNNPYRLENWRESGLLPSIVLLEELQEPLELKSLRQLSRYRRRVSRLSGEQILTEKAHELQNKNAPFAAKKAEPPSIRCELQEWKCINGSRSQLRAQILKMVRDPFTIPEVTAALIRDPKDPCVRNSTSVSTKHYGLFANAFIPKHTVVCEYSGLVRREDEGNYDPNPEYAVKLAQCDEWVCNEGGNYADAFILDAADVFNEASLINDVRDSVLEDDSEPETLRTENVMYVEVLVNKWPRVYIISLQDIPPGEELLIDYGASYWEKLSLTIMKEKLETSQMRNDELESEIVRLRDQLKKQHEYV